MFQTYPSSNTKKLKFIRNSIDIKDILGMSKKIENLKRGKLSTNGSKIITYAFHLS